MVLKGVIVLNKKYCVLTKDKSCPVGASSFVLEIIKTLIDSDLLLGLILYQRDEELESVYLHSISDLGLPVMEINYNSRIKSLHMQNAIIDSVESLRRESGDYACDVALYYQTDVLLLFHPPNFAGIVTHHAPFVEHYKKCYGNKITYDSFGNKSKVLYLQNAQQAALEIKNLFNIEHSLIQKNILKDAGIAPDSIFLIPPPIHVPEKLYGDLPASLSSFIEEGFIVTTAVARLDDFKRIDLLIDACIFVLKLRLRIKIVIIGGENIDSPEAAKLKNRIPESFRKYFLFHPRLNQNLLYKYFRFLNKKGLFVCTSRYETCGITPLEAAVSGLTTIIVNDRKSVEAARYFPKEYRFNPNKISLAEKIIFFCFKKNILKPNLNHNFNVASFRESFMEIWDHIYASYKEQSSTLKV